jgi:hypothetical protein
MQFASPTEHKRGGPKFTDYDSFLVRRLSVIDVVGEGACVEVTGKASTVVGIGVGDQERINEGPTVPVLFEPISKISCDIRNQGVGVVGIRTNVYVNEESAPIEELNEGHVPVVDWEKCDLCGH